MPMAFRPGTLSKVVCMRTYRYQYEHSNRPVWRCSICVLQLDSDGSVKEERLRDVCSGDCSRRLLGRLLPHGQQYHLLFGPIKSYAVCASTIIALGIFDGILGFFRCAEFLAVDQKQFVTPTDGSCSFFGPQFLLFLCASRADPSWRGVTVMISPLSGRSGLRLCTASTGGATFQICRWYCISGLSGSN